MKSTSNIECRSQNQTVLGVFNTLEEKFVEKQGLNLVTSC
jgi:hypothetical protein